MPLKRPLAVPNRDPMVFVMMPTTAAAAAMTAIAPICAFAGGGPTSPNASAIARNIAMLDLRLPVRTDEKTRLQNSIADSPRCRSCAHCLDRAGQLLRQLRNISQAQRELRRELFINLKEWQ